MADFSSPPLFQPLLELSEAQGGYHRGDHTVKTVVEETNELLVVRDAPGFLSFLTTVFGGLTPGLMAKKVEREAKGRGPHFDTYGDLLSPKHPFVTLYNLSGDVLLTTAPLKPELAAAYWAAYPVGSPEAYEARRHFGFVSLTAAGFTSRQGQLSAREGFVLPMEQSAPLVHEVVPLNEELPGEFLKCVAPAEGTEVEEKLRGEGYVPLDELLTSALEGALSPVRPLLIPNVPTITREREWRMPRTPGLLD